MKHLFIIVIIVCSSVLNVYANNNRKIVVDKCNNDVHIIEALGCTPKSITDTKILNIALQQWMTPTDTTFVIITNVNASSSLGAFDNATMLIKLMDDSIIELTSLFSTENNINVRYGNPTVQVSIWKNRITTYYYDNSANVSRNINFWNITPEQIQQLNKGIKKIRIYFQNGIYEKEWKKDKIGWVLMDSYNTLINYKTQNKLSDF